MEIFFRAIIGAALVGLLFGSVHLWFHAIERVRCGQPIVPLAPRRPVPWGLADLLLIFLLLIFTVYGTQQLASAWWKIPLTGDVNDLSPRQFALLMLTSSLAELAACFAALALVRIRAGATRTDLGLVAAELWDDARLGATAFVMLAPPMYLMQIGLTQIWPYEHPVQDLLERQADWSMLLITLVTAVGVAPLAEELLFRVLLQGWLENASVLARKALGLTYGTRFVESDELQRDWRAVMVGDRTGTAFTEAIDADEAPPVADTPPPGDTIAAMEDIGNPYQSPRADVMEPPLEHKSIDPRPVDAARTFRPGYVPIVLSAALFALMHLGQGPAPIPLFFLAIGLGYVYRQTHRATPSIIVHLLVNSLSMAAFWLSLMDKA